MQPGDDRERRAPRGQAAHEAHGLRRVPGPHPLDARQIPRQPPLGHAHGLHLHDVGSPGAAQARKEPDGVGVPRVTGVKEGMERPRAREDLARRGRAPRLRGLEFPRQLGHHAAVPGPLRPLRRIHTGSPARVPPRGSGSPRGSGRTRVRQRTTAGAGSGLASEVGPV